MTLDELFDLAASRHASDIHLATGERPRLRIGGALVALEETIDLSALLAPLLTSEARARLGAGMPAERTIVQGDLAYVGIVFRVGEEGLAATFRIISNRIPALDVVGEGALSLPQRIVDLRRGFALIGGPTGSGKWTTACSIVNAINLERADRIFVIEAHPGFRFESQRGMVTPIHVGQDCDSYLRALDMAHHADPDVIAIDDLPTYEILRRALSLAELGHLVVANLHANSAVDALNRLLESAGDEAPALRRALAENLVAVTGQRLAPREGGGRVPVYEWILNTPRIREALLAGGDLAQIQAEDPECRTVEAALAALVASGKIAA